jgi:hypothetical protein
MKLSLNRLIALSASRSSTRSKKRAFLAEQGHFELAKLCNTSIDQEWVGLPSYANSPARSTSLELSGEGHRRPVVNPVGLE